MITFSSVGFPARVLEQQADMTWKAVEDLCYDIYEVTVSWTSLESHELYEGLT